MGGGHSTGKLGRKAQVAPALPSRRVRNSSNTFYTGDTGVSVVGKRFPTYTYTNLLANYPSACISLSLFLPLVLSICSLYATNGVEHDTSLSGFEISDHTTVHRRGTVDAASEEWRAARERYAFQFDPSATMNFGSSASPDISPQSHPWKRIWIQYKVKSNGIDEGLREASCTGESSLGDVFAAYNLLENDDFLNFAQQLEERIVRLPGWNSVCFKSNSKAGETLRDSSECAPLVSFLQYYYPGQVMWREYGLDNRWRHFWEFRPEMTQRMVLAGGGAGKRIRQRPSSSVLTTYFQNPHWRWFTDQRNDASTRQSALLRTQITIGQPLPGMTQAEATLLVDEFLRELFRYLDKFVEASWEGKQQPDGPRVLDGSPIPPNVQVTYGGDGVLETRVKDAIQTDRLFIALACFFVVIVLWLYCHSFFIAGAALVQTQLSYFSGTFVYSQLYDGELSLLATLAFYIVLVLSCNGVMVYFNTFRHTAFMPTSGRSNNLNVPQRLAFTFRKAGAGVSTSHVVAAVAFACAAVSPVPAVKKFGMLMLILTLGNLYMFLTFFPCILIFHHYHVSRRRRNLQRQKEIQLRRSHSHSPVLLCALREYDNARKDGPIFSHQSGAASWRTTGTVQDTDTEVMRSVVASGAGAEFGAGALAALAEFTRGNRHTGFTPPPPRPDEAQRVEEAAAEFQRLDGAPAGRESRRKQARSCVIRIPPVLAGCSNVGDEGGRQLAVRALVGTPPPDDLNVDKMGAVERLKVYKEVREFWFVAGLTAGMGTYLGPGIVREPQTEALQGGGRRVAMLAQCLRESFADGPLRRRTGAGPLSAEQSALLATPTAMPAAAPTTSSLQVQTGDNLPAAQAGEGMDTQMRLGAPAASPLSPSELLETPKKEGGRVLRFQRWWHERGQQKRRFGRFGKRVGETRDEKDRRIMQKRAKREGFTAMERGFYNQFSPFIRKYHWVILFLFVAVSVGTLIALAEASFLKIRSEPPRLLADSIQEEFDKVRKMFPVPGNCDYCSAYYRPITDFPPPFGRGSGEGVKSLGGGPPLIDTVELEKIRLSEMCQWQMHQPLDTCGVCGGDNLCTDCAGQPQQCNTLQTQSMCLFEAAKNCTWDGETCRDPPRACRHQEGFYIPGWEVDSCGACVPPKGTENTKYMSRGGDKCTEVQPPVRDQCINCVGRWPPVGNCQQCFVQAKIDNNARPPANRVPEQQLDFAKYMWPEPIQREGANYPSCYKDCRPFAAEHGGNCDPARGRCSPFTGDCECHSDFFLGFFGHPNGLESNVPCSVCLPGFYPSPEELRDNPEDWPGVQRPCTSECSLDTHFNDPTCKCRCAVTTPGSAPEVSCHGYRCSVCGGFNSTPRIRSGIGDAPRGTELKGVKVAVGYQCQAKWSSRCKHGSAHPETGLCVCRPGFDDRWLGGVCATSSFCNYHGVIDSRTGQDCQCYSCWTGPRCAESICRNGARCEDLADQSDPWEWKCVCAGVWKGRTCEECPAVCRANGNCPLSWGRDTAAAADRDHRYSECWGCKGNWQGRLCERCVAPAGVPEYRRASAEKTCTANGDIVGCDGLPATDEPGSYKWLANCTGKLTCVGQTATSATASCVGCDGMPGSTTTVDQCGVCGGFNECSCDGTGEFARKKATLELVWGLIAQSADSTSKVLYSQGTTTDFYAVRGGAKLDPKFMFQDSGTQRHLLWVCQQLMRRPDQIEPHQSDCWLEDWANWLQSRYLAIKVGETPSNATGAERFGEIRLCQVNNCFVMPLEGPGERFVQLRFPWSGTKKHEVEWLLYQFMKETERFDMFGFNTANENSPDLKLQWLRMKFTLRLGSDTAPETAQDRYKYWELITKEINLPRWRQPGDLLYIGNVFQWSQLWVDAYSQLQAKAGASYSVGIAAACFLVVVLVFSCSVVLTGLCCVTVTGVVICIVGMMKVLDWELGPTEQVGLVCLVGLSAEYTVHLVSGYQDCIHAFQSTLLARSTTREQAIATTLQRTGVPICVSAVTMTVASLILFACQILVYRRIAEMMVFNILFSAVAGLMVFPSLLMALGPTSIRRSLYFSAMHLSLSTCLVCVVLMVLYFTDAANGPTGEPLFS
eukprot:Hpha_TRINITY_DN16842_c2_g5::TRINITY_DN16842_c2_g5_i1::g.150174::m.150174